MRGMGMHTVLCGGVGGPVGQRDGHGLAVNNAHAAATQCLRALALAAGVAVRLDLRLVRQP